MFNDTARKHQLVRAHAPCDSTIEDLRGLVKSLEAELKDAISARKNAQDERNKVKSPCFRTMCLHSC